MERGDGFRQADFVGIRIGAKTLTTGQRET